MSAAQDTVHEYLRERFDHIFIDPDDGEVAAPIAFPGAAIWLRVHVRERRELVAVSSHFPVRIPPYLFAAMSEYLQRCSDGLCTGGFQLDFETGAVVFRTSQFYGGTTLAKDHVAHLVGANLSTVRAVLPGVMAVAYGGMAPKDAVDLPAWPEQLLEEDLDRTLEEILGSKGGPACAAEATETAGSPDNASSSESAAMEPTSAPAAGTELPEAAVADDDRAGVLDRLQDLLRQIVAEEEGASTEAERADDEEAAA